MTAVMWLWVCILIREEIGKLPGKWATCLEAISKLYPHYMCIKLYPQNILHPYTCHYTTILLYHHQIFCRQKKRKHIWLIHFSGWNPGFFFHGFRFFSMASIHRFEKTGEFLTRDAVLLKNRVFPHVHPIAQRRIRLGGATGFGSMAWAWDI